jgi:hypothetical protein
MTYLELQQEFAQKVSELIFEAIKLGYQVTLGEAWRPRLTAEFYASQHMGISNSLHTHRLAIDLNLFKDGKFLVRKEDYEPLGVVWKSWSKKEYRLCWGGDFKSPDSDHFSLAYEGLE